MEQKHLCYNTCKQIKKYHLECKCSNTMIKQPSNRVYNNRLHNNRSQKYRAQNGDLSKDEAENIPPFEAKEGRAFGQPNQ